MVSIRLRSYRIVDTRIDQHGSIYSQSVVSISGSLASKNDCQYLVGHTYYVCSNAGHFRLDLLVAAVILCTNNR